MDKPELRDPFYFFRVIGDQFEIRRSKEILGYVRDTQQRGARRYLAESVDGRKAYGKTKKQAARRVIPLEEIQQ